jgi:hypothetical protein
MAAVASDITPHRARSVGRADRNGQRTPPRTHESTAAAAAGSAVAASMRDASPARVEVAAVYRRQAEGHRGWPAGVREQLDSAPPPGTHPHVSASVANSRPSVVGGGLGSAVLERPRALLSLSTPTAPAAAASVSRATVAATPLALADLAASHMRASPPAASSVLTRASVVASTQREKVCSPI